MNLDGNHLRMTAFEFPVPTIVLFGPMHTDIRPLQAFFRTMSVGNGSACLTAQPFVVCLRPVEIIAECLGSIRQMKSLGMVEALTRTDVAGFRFRWVKSQEGWEDMADLIDSFNDSHTLGHHYLAEHPRSDVTVILSVGEYSDEDFRR